MNLEEIKDLKEEICFYDKVVLNKMLEVDKLRVSKYLITSTLIPKVPF